MKKFRATSTGIKEFEVLKETDKQVVYKYVSPFGAIFERREVKLCDWYSWHDTHAAAKDYLIEKQMCKIGELKLQIEKCKETIEKIKEL